jgi:hypothetical protein
VVRSCAHLGWAFVVKVQTVGVRLGGMSGNLFEWHLIGVFLSSRARWAPMLGFVCCRLQILNNEDATSVTKKGETKVTCGATHRTQNHSICPRAMSLWGSIYRGVRGSITMSSLPLTINPTIEYMVNGAIYTITTCNRL